MNLILIVLIIAGTELLPLAISNTNQLNIYKMGYTIDADFCLLCALNLVALALQSMGELQWKLINFPPRFITIIMMSFILL